jgi:hypothetical protein
MNEILRNVGEICWTYVSKVKGKTKDGLCTLPVHLFRFVCIRISLLLLSHIYEGDENNGSSFFFSCDKTSIKKAKVYH